MVAEARSEPPCGNRVRRRFYRRCPMRPDLHSQRISDGSPGGVDTSVRRTWRGKPGMSDRLLICRNLGHWPYGSRTMPHCPGRTLVLSLVLVLGYSASAVADAIDGD